MIDLIIGIVIGLMPAALILYLAWEQRGELRDLQADYDELKKRSRQLCRETEIAKIDATRFRAERDAESERASANSERVQQLQEEADRLRVRVANIEGRDKRRADQLDSLVETLRNLVEAYE